VGEGCCSFLSPNSPKSPKNEEKPPPLCWTRHSPYRRVSHCCWDHLDRVQARSLRRRNSLCMVGPLTTHAELVSYLLYNNRIMGLRQYRTRTYNCIWSLHVCRSTRFVPDLDAYVGIADILLESKTSKHKIRPDRRAKVAFERPTSIAIGY